MARNMSQAEIDRRKKLQAASSRVGGALGLGSLAAFGASKVPGSRLVARAAPKFNAKLVQTPRTRNAEGVKVDPVLTARGQKMKDRYSSTALGLSTAGAGLGGVSSYNFAAYTSAEARQRKKKQGIAKLGPATIEERTIISVPKDGGHAAEIDRVHLRRRKDSPILRRPRYKSIRYSSVSEGKKADRYSHYTTAGEQIGFAGKKGKAEIERAIQTKNMNGAKVKYTDSRVKKSDSISAFGIEH